MLYELRISPDGAGPWKVACKYDSKKEALAHCKKWAKANPSWACKLIAKYETIWECDARPELTEIR